MRRGICILIVGFVFGGCVATDDSQDEPTEPFEPGQSLAALISVDDCDDLLSTLQAQAMEQMEQRIDDNLAQTLVLYEQYGGDSGTDQNRGFLLYSLHNLLPISPIAVGTPVTGS